MIERNLGATELTVSAIGLGLAALGRPAYINLGREEDLGPKRTVPQMERRTRQVLDAAWGAGVRYLDAARSYGRAEEFLASWLAERNLAPDRLTVGSKWGYTYVGDWRLDAPVHEVKDHGLETFRRQVRESRASLGPHLDLYQVHSATLESGVLEDRAVLAALLEWRIEEGITIGLTTSGPRQGEVIERAFGAEVDGVQVFQTVQATWNVLEPSAAPALMGAHHSGWGVIVKEALANGRLTDHGHDPVVERLGNVASRYGVGVDGLAIAAALAQPWAHVVLSGAATPDQLRSNLEALSVHLEAADLEHLADLAEPVDTYWGIRDELDWS